MGGRSIVNRPPLALVVRLPHQTHSRGGGRQPGELAEDAWAAMEEDPIPSGRGGKNNKPPPPPPNYIDGRRRLVEAWVGCDAERMQTMRCRWEEEQMTIVKFAATGRRTIELETCRMSIELWGDTTENEQPSRT